MTLRYIVDRKTALVFNKCMAISDADVQKLRNALLPDIEKIVEEKNALQTQELKEYIHEGVDAVVEGVDNLLNEKGYDSRIKKLENIHPQGRHPVN